MRRAQATEALGVDAGSLGGGVGVRRGREQSAEVVRETWKAKTLPVVANRKNNYVELTWVPGD